MTCSLAFPLALLLACTVADPVDGNGGADPGGALELAIFGAVKASPVSPPACDSLGAPGAVVWSHDMGLANVGISDDLAVDARGDVLIADRSATDADRLGLSKLASSDGSVLYARPFGMVVAADIAGNAYVAGSFTAPIDLGFGTIQPQGDVDVFVAKLDPGGRVLFARALGLCGDSVESIAVDATGRIAVSGAAMGTTVLSPSGDPELSLAFSGDLAFDSNGNLVVTGTFTTIDLGSGPVASRGFDDAFVAKVDCSGEVMWSAIVTGDLANRIAGTSVAVDANDNVVIIGDFDRSIDLFGETFKAIYAGESGRVEGAYLVKLDASGNVIWKQGRFAATDTSAVATDPGGNIFVSGAVTGNIPPFRITMLSKVDVAGAPVWTFEMAPASGYGEGYGVATDACGNAYWAVTARDEASVLSPTRSYVVELAR